MNSIKKLTSAFVSLLVLALVPAASDAATIVDGRLASGTTQSLDTVAAPNHSKPARVAAGTQLASVEAREFPLLGTSANLNQAPATRNAGPRSGSRSAPTPEPGNSLALLVSQGESNRLAAHASAGNPSGQNASGPNGSAQDTFAQDHFSSDTALRASFDTLSVASPLPNKDVPEPSSLALFAAGLLGVAALFRHRLRSR